MAKYIQPGIEYIPTTIEYTGTLTMTRRSDDKDLKQFIAGAMIPVGDSLIYINSLTQEWIARDVKRITMDWKVNGVAADNLLLELKKYGAVTYRIKQNYYEYEHNGYVKHDVEKRHEVSEIITVRLQDILPDKDGNKWEVFVMEADGYYCDLCQDTHDECIEKHLFKTQAEAEEKYQSIIEKAA